MKEIAPLCPRKSHGWLQHKINIQILMIQDKDLI